MLENKRKSFNDQGEAECPALESLSSVSVTDGQIDSWRAVLLFSISDS